MIAPMSGSQASTISAAEKTFVKRDTGQNAATKPPKNTSGKPKSLNANGRPRGVGNAHLQGNATARAAPMSVQAL